MAEKGAQRRLQQGVYHSSRWWASEISRMCRDCWQRRPGLSIFLTEDPHRGLCGPLWKRETSRLKPALHPEAEVAEAGAPFGGRTGFLHIVLDCQGQRRYRLRAPAAVAGWRVVLIGRCALNRHAPFLLATAANPLIAPCI